ncbi:outer membrane protein [Neomegalonema perideroedes]|uniref:outer membrane protein n=1 Tax=Neomegalonema perideroedes TaxID=217219 RepID=UPI00039C08B2|nr:outer membrane beta-barrel protein [Neomegalonema perideroedes]
MKRHLLLYTALFAGVAGSALAGGYSAAPYGGGVHQGAVMGAGQVGQPVAAPGQPVFVNGRQVYDDRGAVQTGGAIWGGDFAGAAYGAPVVERQVVSEEYLLQQQAAYGAVQAPAQAGYGVARQGVAAGAPIYEQTTTTQDIVAVTSVQPTLAQTRGGWGPRVFVGVQGGASLGGAFSSADQTLKIDRGYNFGVHAGVAFGGGWRAKVEYLRLAGKIEVAGYEGGDCGPQKPDCGGGKSWGGKSGHGGGGHGGGSGGGYYEETLDYTANAGFVTVEKAFEVSKTFQPYVGLGVGYVNPKIDGGDPLKGSIGVKASVGASVALSDQIEAFGEYAYVVAPDVECDCGSDGLIKVDYDTHLLSAGLRISFN